MPTEISTILAESTVERRFSKGTHIHTQGRPATTIHYIVRGEVEIRRNGAAIRQMGSRMIVGGLSALAEDDQGYDCVALQDTTTLALQADDGQEIFEDHFVFQKESSWARTLKLLRCLKSSAKMLDSFMN